MSPMCLISYVPGINGQIKVFDSSIESDPIFLVFHGFQYQDNSGFFPFNELAIFKIIIGEAASHLPTDFIEKHPVQIISGASLSNWCCKKIIIGDIFHALV
jgi:hypothetical protein